MYRAGGWSVIGLEESEPWDINSSTGFIYEKLHGSDAFFTLSYSIDDMNSSIWSPRVRTVLCITTVILTIDLHTT